jgi:hypothetical protein
LSGYFVPSFHFEINHLSRQTHAFKTKTRNKISSQEPLFMNVPFLNLLCKKKSTIDMILNFFNSKYKMSEASNSTKTGHAFDDLITMALAFEKAKIIPGQYTTAEADSDKLKTPPSAAGLGNKRGNNAYWEGETALLTSPLELKNYSNPSETKINELTLALTLSDQIHYIFIIDALGEIWYEKEIDQFEQILKIDTDHLPNGRYNILIENDGSFSSKQFIVAK